MAGRPQGRGSRDLRERAVLDLDELRADPDEQPDIRDPLRLNLSQLRCVARQG
jgi:hypothetical protein